MIKSWTYSDWGNWPIKFLHLTMADRLYEALPKHPVKVYAAPAVIQRLRDSLPFKQIVTSRHPADDTITLYGLPVIEREYLEGDSYAIEYSDGTLEFGKLTGNTSPGESGRQEVA